MFPPTDPGAPPQSQEGGQETRAQKAQEGPRRAQRCAVQGGAPAGSRAEEAEGKMELVGAGARAGAVPLLLGGSFVPFLCVHVRTQRCT